MPADLVQSLSFPVLPQRVSALLKRAQRQDVASSLLLTSLESYSRTQTQATSQITVDEASPAELEQRSVYYLQLIGQLLEAFGAKLLDGDIDRVLRFIDYACTQHTPHTPADTKEAPSTLDALRNIQDQEEDAPGAEHDWELVNTALNLFLSLLEGHTELVPQTTPMLQVLRHKVEGLRDAPDAEVRALSQEVVLVLSARQQQAAPPSSTAVRPKYLDVYQEALQYLQDPIIPVRAHGLHLLSQLVSKDKKVHSECYGDELDPALLPAIFDIFMNAIQDEESFLYLNAVKGLAQMAAHWRDATLRPLVALYVGGDKTQNGMACALEYGQELSQRETDKRLRIGEALLQVLQHCGEAIVPAVALIVNPLLTAVRNPVFSATLRSSFISILGTCVEVAPTALASSGASEDMARLCRELVQVESVRRPMMRKAHVTAHVTGKDATGEQKRTAIDDDDDECEKMAEKEGHAGTDVDPKLPQLRRAALLLLAVLLRSTRHQLDAFLDARQHQLEETPEPESLSALRLPGGGMLPETRQTTSKVPAPVPLLSMQAAQHLVPVMSYVATEDVDALVRQQASDCLDEVRLLESAHISARAAGLS